MKQFKVQRAVFEMTFYDAFSGEWLGASAAIFEGTPEQLEEKLGTRDDDLADMMAERARLVEDGEFPDDVITVQRYNIIDEHRREFEDGETPELCLLYPLGKCDGEEE